MKKGERLLPPFHRFFSCSRFGLLLYRQIVRVNVAVKTDREFLQHIGFVRLAMAGGALGNEPVAGVAFRTVDLTMLAGSGLPFGVDVAVASAASCGVHVAVENNVQWLVRLMAAEAIGHLLLIQVGLMAIQT